MGICVYVVLQMHLPFKTKIQQTKQFQKQVCLEDDSKPANLATTSLLDAWNNEYMKSVRRMMLKVKSLIHVLNALRKKMQDIEAKDNGKQ